MVDASTNPSTTSTAQLNLTQTPANIVDNNLPPQAAAATTPYVDPYAGLIPSDKYPGKWYNPQTGITFTPTVSYHPELMSGEQRLAQTTYEAQQAFSQAKTLEDYLALQPIGKQMQIERYNIIMSQATNPTLPTQLTKEQVAYYAESARVGAQSLWTGSSPGLSPSDPSRYQSNAGNTSSFDWNKEIALREQQAITNSLPGTTFTAAQHTALTTPRAGEISGVYTANLASVGSSTYAPVLSLGVAAPAFTTPVAPIVAQQVNPTELKSQFDIINNYLLSKQNQNPFDVTTRTAIYDPSVVKEYGSMDTTQGKLNLAELAILGFDITGAAVALKGWSDSVSNSITKARDTGYSIAPEALTKSWVGLVSGAAQTVPFVAALPYGAVYTVTNPTLAPSKGAEILAATGTDLGSRALTNPAGVTGELVGMYIGGKAIGKGLSIANEASPIKLNIAEVVTTAAAEGEKPGITYIAYIATQRPFASLFRDTVGVKPLPTVRAFVATGDYAGSGFGAPTEFLKSLPEVNSPPIMRVRPGEGIQPMNKAQQAVLDPYFREVARGTVEEPYVNAALDAKLILPQTEAAFGGDYTLRGGFSAAELYKVQPEVKAAAMEAIAKYGGRYVGSTSLVDLYGKPNVRDVSMSDIDVSVTAKNMGELKYGPGGLNEIFAQNEPKIEIGTKPGEKGYVLSTGETEHVAAIGSSEKYADVRTFDVTTPEGNVLKYGTPEYQIETKFSRLGGRESQTIGLRYTQEGGLEVPLDLKKGPSDFADIFSGTAYLSRETAIKGMPYVSRAYEGIATNIRTYAEATGNAEKFSEIVGDPLAEARAARAIRRNLGGVLGVEMGVTEYPSALKTTIPEGRAIPTVGLSALGEYPMATTLEAGATPTYPVSYGASTSSPITVTTTGTYGSFGGMAPETYYGVAGFYPGDYNRFMTYPAGVTTTGGYPSGTPYPSGGQYPGSTPYPGGGVYPGGGNYPQTYPTGYPTTYPTLGPNIPKGEINIALPPLTIIKSEDRITQPPIKTRNFFKFHEILQGVDYSRVNLKTGYGGKLGKISSKKTKYFDVQNTVKQSPIGLVGTDETGQMVVQNQFIEKKVVKRSFKQFSETSPLRPVPQGPDFNKAKFNIPSSQRYNRRFK
jgi:hypothetical protein